MSDRSTSPALDRVRSDGEWWVLTVTDGLSTEFPPELYRDHDLAHSEAERWARVLSRRSHSSIERPFEDRWHVGDEWIRLSHAFLPEEGHEIWVLTYWTRDGYPEPEAGLTHDAVEARAWVLEARVGATLLESHDTPWSALARFQVRGGEEEAETHRAKFVCRPAGRAASDPEPQTVFGFEISEGLIPQGPILLHTKRDRDEELRAHLQQVVDRPRVDWREIVRATAEGNYVHNELPVGWDREWSQAEGIDWLLGFDFISDGDRIEIRRFEAEVN